MITQVNIQISCTRNEHDTNKLWHSSGEEVLVSIGDTLSVLVRDCSAEKCADRLRWKVGLIPTESGPNWSYSGHHTTGGIGSSCLMLAFEAPIEMVTRAVVESFPSAAVYITE